MIRLSAFIFILTIVRAQAQLAENFTDGNFTANPAWNGSVNHFIINAEGELQLKNTTAGDSYLTTSLAYSSLDNLEWGILVKQTFAGSSANFGRVYLTSSQEDLSSPLTGYYLQFGKTGNNHAIEIFRQTGTTSTRVCRGTEAAIAANFTTARIKVTRNASGLWEVWADLTGGNNFVKQASGTDVVHTTSNYFGVRCKYALAQATKFYYDDISVRAKQTNSDTTPPVIDKVVFTQATTATVIFNEEVAEGAAILSNYSIDTKTIATAVLQSDNKTVALTLTSPLANGNTYTVSVANVKDLAGNVVVNYSAAILYFQETAAAFNDIVINEVFPDPAPPEALPEYEFLELYNRSEKAFDLKDWKISGGTKIGIFPSKIIQPKEYLIVTGTSSVSAYSSYGKTIGIAFPTLKNSGDKITLHDKNELKIDELNYTTSFYQNADKSGGGWTLERLNPEVGSHEVSNWRASTNARGGTPGSVNSVFGINPDNQPPTLETVFVKNQNQITLRFSEKIKALQVEGNNGLGKPTASNLLPDGQTAELTFPNFENGVAYQLTISAEDLAGNRFSGVRDFRYFQPSPCYYKDIVFSEVMSDPAPPVRLPEVEYIEVYNRSAAAVDLGGWTLSDATTTATLPSFIIFPKEYVALMLTTNVSKFSTKALGVSHFPSLSNSGESLVLRNGDKVIDSIHYSLEWHKETEKKDGGWSLEIIDTENSCGEENNWEGCEDAAGGTPGKSNSVKGNNPDLTPPKLVSAFPQNNLLVLTFNEKLHASIAIKDFSLEPPVDIAKVFFFDKTKRKVSLQTSLQKDVFYKVTARVSDCAGNNMESDNSLTFALPDEALKGEVVINEILFNPKTSGVDFIELYNNSPHFFNLKDWKIGNRTASSKNFSEELFAPRTYKILTTDITTLANHYPKTQLEAAIICNPPSLPNEEGALVLTNGRQVIDSAHYNERQHHALLHNNEGISLERISFTAPSTDAGNWCSSGEGATPGYLNSCSQKNAASEAEIWVEPAQFAPELPGQDFARLNYKFERGGKTATITVMDAMGREVKKLAVGEILNTEGSLRWDGDTDGGRKAEPGYYFFWMEVVDLEGSVRVFRKRVVVCSR